MEVTVRVCDKCQDPAKAAHSYTVARDGDSVRVDLCPDHSTVLEELLARVEAPRRAPSQGAKKTPGRKPKATDKKVVKPAGKKTAKKTPGRRSMSSRSSRVRTLEEIDPEFSG